MITSRSNFLIKLIRSLSDKAARDEHSLFVAEGVQTVKEALASGFSVERVAATVKGFSLLASAAPGFCRLKISTDGATCAEKRDSKTELYTGENTGEKASESAGVKKTAKIVVKTDGRAASEPEFIVNSADGTAVKTELLSDDVFHTVSGENSPQGVLALVRKPQNADALPKGSCVFLDGLQDPSNVGAIIRTAAAAGYDGVLLADCADAYNPKAVRASMGGIFKVKLFVGGRAELLALNDKPIIVADMDGENAFIPKERGELCLVIGNEGRGVSEEIRRLANETVSIPMQNGMESLNAAVSAGVLMYALKNRAK